MASPASTGGGKHDNTILPPHVHRTLTHLVLIMALYIAKGRANNRDLLQRPPQLQVQVQALLLGGLVHQLGRQTKASRHFSDILQSSV